MAPGAPAMFIIIFLWLFLSYLTGRLCENWGRSFYRGFMLSLLLSPLIGLAALLIAGPNRKEIENRQIASGEMKKCPHCAELIRAEAAKCRYCGSIL